MEILIITHGETDYHLKKSNNPDLPMCSLGTNKIRQLTNWIKSNIKLNNFLGLTSPYCSCLETVSIIQEKINLDFVINQTIRDFIFINESKGINLLSRKNKFKNIQWNSFWDKKSVHFKSEIEEDLKKRINSMISKIDSKNNYFFVTHPFVAKFIFYSLCNENINSPDYASVTYVKDKKPIWHSKIVYDE